MMASNGSCWDRWGCALGWPRVERPLAARQRERSTPTRVSPPRRVAKEWEPPYDPSAAWYHDLDSTGNQRWLEPLLLGTDALATRSGALSLARTSFGGVDGRAS